MKAKYRSIAQWAVVLALLTLNLLTIIALTGINGKMIEDLKTHTPGFDKTFYNNHKQQNTCFETRHIIKMDYKTGLGTAQNYICDSDNKGHMGEAYAYNRDENGQWRPFAP